MMFTQGYVWILAEIYLGTKNNPNASSKDDESACADHTAGSEMENHEADEKADGLKCKHETDRACYKDDCNSH